MYYNKILSLFFCKYKIDKFISKVIILFRFHQKNRKFCQIFIDTHSSMFLTSAICKKIFLNLNVDNFVNILIKITTSNSKYIIPL